MNDLIYRQAAIDALNDGAELFRRVLDDVDVVGNEREKFEWGLGLIESYIDDMKDLPSAQPERKRGAWVGVGFYDEDCGHHLWYACDKCSYQTTWHMKPIFNFCPNCGADMRGEQDDSLSD